MQPVPQLGGVDASKAEVEGFYDFWYNFDSWRSFEYLDKEVNEGSDRFVQFCSSITVFSLVFLHDLMTIHSLAYSIFSISNLQP